MKNIGLTFALLMILALSGYAQQRRNVFWLHGLGENETTWAIYESVFENARQMDGYNGQYTSGSGFATACADVTGTSSNSTFPNVPSTVRANSQNIAVGHSFGGVVARDIHRRYSQDPAYTNMRFGGIITVGSPNGGGRLANNMQTGSVDAALNDACSRLVAGPQSGLIGATVTVVNGTVSWNHTDMCNALRSQILEPMYGSGITSFQIYADTAGTVNQVREGSPEMTALNGFSTNIHRISVHGNEQSPVHWRLASSFLTANLNDELVPQIAAQMRGIYHANVVLNQSLAMAYAITFAWIPTTKFLMLAAHHNNRMHRWQEGVQWFDNSETVWNHLIGAQRIETRPVTTSVLKSSCENQLALLEVKLEMARNAKTRAKIQQQINALINDPNCYELTTVQIQVPVNESSDGLFHRTSQIGEVTNNSNIYEAMGVNHSEETNTIHGQTLNGNDEMRRVLDLVWDRPNLDFFRVQ